MLAILRGFGCPSRRCVVTPPADRTPFPENSPSHLVGRDRELRDLRRLLDLAMDGRGQLVLLGGEAGVGKTTIAEALCREAADRGALAIVGRCYDLTDTPPYGPWTDAFGDYQPEGDLPSPLATIPRTEAADAITTRSALYDRVRTFVATLAEHRPLVMLLEDLHWADPESLDLLRVVSREAASQALLVLATFRGDELESTHPLYRLLPVLERESGARRFELRRLHQEALHELVATTYHMTEVSSARLVAYLYAQAGGNPFFTQQLLRALEEDEVLRPLGNRWVLGDLTGAGVPLALRQVIEARLLRLDEEGQQLLRTAAVIGQDVSFPLWTSVVGSEEEGLLVLVEEATAARLIEPEADGAGFRFVHALVREALYEGINPLRRRIVHRRVGEMLAAFPSPDPDAVAYHFRRAGDARAVEWLVEAGERAERTSALLTAAERYEAALDLPDARLMETAEHGWLRLRLATLQRFRKPREALTHVEAAEKLAQGAGDPALVAHVLLVRGLLRVYADGIRDGLQDVAAGVEMVEKLPPRGDAQRGSEQSIDAAAVNPGMLVAMLSWAGRLAEAKERGEGYLAHAADRQKAASLAGAWWGMALVHAMQGRPDQARRAYESARAAYENLDQHRLLAFVLRDELTFTVLPYLSDHLAERERVATAAEQAVLRGNAAGAIDEPAEYARYPKLPLMVLEGEWREARRIISVLAEYGAHAILRHIISSFLGPLARDQGERDLAWQQVYKTWPGGPNTEPGDGDIYYTLPLQRLAVELSLDNGDLASAKEWLEAHDRWLSWSGAVLGLSEAQALRARYELVSGNSEESYRRAEQALAHASEPRQPLALLAAHRLLGELGGAGGRYDDAASHLDDALQLADTCAAPYERALTLLTVAELRLAERNDAELPTVLEEVRGICSDLGAAPALALADALTAQTPGGRRATSAYPAGLTRREAQVLGLLAAGRSNKEIAAELFLSERTVERHITTVYRKIGTHRRTEAMAFALRHGLADIEETSGE